jgi:hypothetical protein
MLAVLRFFCNRINSEADLLDDPTIPTFLQSWIVSEPAMGKSVSTAYVQQWFDDKRTLLAYQGAN